VWDYKINLDISIFGILLLAISDAFEYTTIKKNYGPVS